MTNKKFMSGQVIMCHDVMEKSSDIVIKSGYIVGEWLLDYLIVYSIAQYIHQV